MCFMVDKLAVTSHHWYTGGKGCHSENFVVWRNELMGPQEVQQMGMRSPAHGME